MQETKAALMLMWATQEGLPVFCENHTSGVSVTGTFKIIDGRCGCPSGVVLASGAAPCFVCA
jgi:hypothetical protein